MLIPIGVAVCEEVAFCGVLLAVVRRQLPVRSASAVTSVTFGLWHVSVAPNDSRVSLMLAGASVAGTVVLTGLGGLLFAWPRLRRGSLLAPIGRLLGTDSVGPLAAAVAAR